MSRRTRHDASPTRTASPICGPTPQLSPGAAEHAADTLDALSTTREVRHIRIAEVWSGPITSADDLDTALARLREAVLAQLDDDTEVRFR